MGQQSTGRMLVAACMLVAFVLSGCVSSQDPDDGPAEPEPLPPVVGTVEHESIDGKLRCAGPSVNPCFALEGSQNVAVLSVGIDLQTLLVGVQWTPSAPTASTLSLEVSTNDQTLEEPASYTYARVAGEPGFVLRLDNADVPAEHGWTNESGAKDLRLRVFPDGPSAFVEQDFQWVIAAYYGVAAPEDASPFESHDAMDSDGAGGNNTTLLV